MRKKSLNIYQIAAIIITIVGLIFVYIAAEVDDAPGLIIIGSAAVIGATLILYGFGELLKT